MTSDYQKTSKNIENVCIFILFHFNRALEILMFQTREEDYIVHLWYMHKKCKLFGEKKSLSTYSLSTTVSWNSTQTHHPSTRFSKLPSVFRTGFMAICSIYCNANLNKFAFFFPPQQIEIWTLDRFPVINVTNVDTERSGELHVDGANSNIQHRRWLTMLVYKRDS